MESQPLVASQSCRIAGEGALDLERGMERAAGMVLVSDRCTEEGHDAVARELIDGALPSVHGVEHELEGAVHHGMELLGIHGAGQLGGALDVDEEDRDLLTLAAQG